MGLVEVCGIMLLSWVWTEVVVAIIEGGGKEEDEGEDDDRDIAGVGGHVKVAANDNKGLFYKETFS